MEKSSYWQGHAPGYSVAVEEAHKVVLAAEAALLEALKQSYPRGAAVRVVHYRGSFHGEVAGWDTDGVRVLVRNVVSDKCAKWWAAHVELAAQSSGQDAGR